MTNYYRLENNIIMETTNDKEFSEKLGCDHETEKEIKRGYDGKLYFEDELPEKPQEVIDQERIAELKKFLSDADYWGQKYIDGEYTEAEWEEKKAQRKAWREEIRRLEGDE